MDTSKEFVREIAAIKKEHEAVVSTFRKGLEHAKKAGDILAKLKPQVIAAGLRWEVWVEKDCDMNRRTANNYIRISEKWEELKAKDSTASTVKGYPETGVLLKPQESQGDDARNCPGARKPCENRTDPI